MRTIDIINPASPEHSAQMRALAEFAQCDSITYRDLGSGEDYVLTRGQEVLTLNVRGNKDQGGFLCVDSLRTDPQTECRDCGYTRREHDQEEDGACGEFTPRAIRMHA